MAGEDSTANLHLEFPVSELKALETKDPGAVFNGELASLADQATPQELQAISTRQIDGLMEEVGIDSRELFFWRFGTPNDLFRFTE